MGEFGGQQATLADVIAVANMLQHRASDFAKRFVDLVDSVIHDCDGLLPDTGETHIMEYEDDSVITRHFCYEFRPYVSEGEEIPVIDDLSAMIDDDSINDLMKEFWPTNNLGTVGFYRQVLSKSVVFLLEYRAEASEDSKNRFPHGDFNFNVDKFPTHFGSGSAAALPLNTK